MDAKLIVLNGRTYRSVEEMPPDVREKYELAICLVSDADEEFIPSKFRSKKVLANRNRDTITDMKIIIDGKEFDSIDDLPPEARARYAQALGKLDANRNGIPDFVEGMRNSTNPTANVSTSFGSETTPRTPDVDYAPSARTSQDKPMSVDSVITTDPSNSWPLALVGVFVLLLCIAGAAGAWYYFLR